MISEVYVILLAFWWSLASLVEASSFGERNASNRENNYNASISIVPARHWREFPNYVIRCARVETSRNSCVIQGYKSKTVIPLGYNYIYLDMKSKYISCAVNLDVYLRWCETTNQIKGQNDNEYNVTYMIAGGFGGVILVILTNKQYASISSIENGRKMDIPRCFKVCLTHLYAGGQ